jgi:hypothetical protein
MGLATIDESAVVGPHSERLRRCLPAVRRHGQAAQAARGRRGDHQPGFPEGVIIPLGLIEVACLIAYLAPRASALGAILWTGYLGGAIATNVRVGSPLFSQTLFPIYVATLLWVGLWLRDQRLRAVLPLRAATRAGGT